MKESHRQALTSRAYCLHCEQVATFFPAGVLADGVGPRVERWRCKTCGHTRVQYADVTDVEQLCRTILDRWIAARGIDIDYGDALSLMMMEAWDLYTRWDGETLTFTSYATGLLRFRVNNIGRNAFGRNGSKTPEGGLVSLDEESEEGGAGLAGAVAAREGDPAMDRSPDLDRALAQGAGRTVQPLPPRYREPGAAAGRERGLGVEPHAGAAA